MTNPTPISIIVLAASQDAAKLVVSALQKAGYAIQGKVATNHGMLEQGLAMRDWDAIISWEETPQSLDISKTVEIVNSAQTSTPILIVCRTLDEELRYKALKEGAVDAISLRHPLLLKYVLDRELSRRAALKSENTISEKVSATDIINPNLLSDEDNIWRKRIKKALEQDHFYCAYQPIANLNAEPHHYYELLLRMVDENGREISPGAFLGTAEKAGIMSSIDRWVIRKAISSLHKKVDAQPDTCFFIKLSSESVRDKDLTAWILSQLYEAKLPRHSIAFEIAAEDVQQNPRECTTLIKKLRQINCLMVIDRVKQVDEALSQVIGQGVDFIKISGDLINDVTKNNAHQRTVVEIAAFARANKLKTIAQFIESAASLAFLWQNGINYIQGHYIQRPDTHMEYDFNPDKTSLGDTTY